MNDLLSEAMEVNRKDTTPRTAAGLAQQAEFALGSYAHGLTPSKTFNAQQFEDWKRMLAEYRAAIEAEAAAPADSAETMLRAVLSSEPEDIKGLDYLIVQIDRRDYADAMALLQAAPQRSDSPEAES